MKEGNNHQVTSEEIKIPAKTQEISGGNHAIGVKDLVPVLRSVSRQSD